MPAKKLVKLFWVAEPCWDLSKYFDEYSSMAQLRFILLGNVAADVVVDAADVVVVVVVGVLAIYLQRAAAGLSSWLEGLH